MKVRHLSMDNVFCHAKPFSDKLSILWKEQRFAISCNQNISKRFVILAREFYLNRSGFLSVIKMEKAKMEKHGKAKRS